MVKNWKYNLAVAALISVAFIFMKQTLAILDDLILTVQSLNDPPVNLPSHLKYPYCLDTCYTDRSQESSITMFQLIYYYYHGGF